MVHTTDVDEEALGKTLTTLSNSADGLSKRVRELNRAVDDLQASTERWSESQRAASESLSRAADSLATPSTDGPSAGVSSASGFAPADD